MADSKPQISTRRIAISKANAQMVAVVGIASFVTVFCLIAAKAVFSQNAYTAHVINAKTKANNQLKDNINTFASLQKSYKKFDSAPKNIIGGSKSGSGNSDGSNSTIVLDALPDRYDFPALASSVEKILTSSNLKVSSIKGTDDQLAQQSNLSSPNPQPVEMDFSFTVDSASYTSVAQLMSLLEQSIRPIQIDTFDLSGASDNMTLIVNAHTYYQPSKDVSITSEVVK